jgi:hypothetical protein
VGWSGEARGPAEAPSRRTHNYAAGFLRAPQSPFALEPNAVARPAGETPTQKRSERQADTQARPEADPLGRPAAPDDDDDDAQRTGTTKQTQQQAQRQGSGQRNNRSRAKTDRRTDPAKRQQRQNRSGRRTTKTPAQQTPVQDDRTAALRRGPRPTPPSACLTHAVRKGIGRSPGGTPATPSLGSPESRVGFWTAPQTILQGVREAQVAVRRGEANGTTPLGELRL